MVFSRLVLNDVPVLDQNAVLDTKYVCRNPVHRETHAAEAPMHDYKAVVGNYQPWFVLQGRRNALYNFGDQNVSAVA